MEELEVSRVSSGSVRGASSGRDFRLERGVVG